MIGGFGTNQIDKLYGGSGDDKIWLINPEEREFDIMVGQNYGYGGQDDDFVYGSDGNDLIIGDDYFKTDSVADILD